MEHEYNYQDAHINFHHSIDEHPDQAAFKMHLHEQLEIYCYVSGDAVYLVEGTVYPLTPGSILLMRPSESHMVKLLSDAPYERYALHFLPDIVHSIDPDGRLLAPFFDHPLGQDNLYLPLDFALEQPLAILRNMCHADTAAQKRLAVTTRLFLLLEAVQQAHTIKTTQAAAPTAENITQKMLDYVNAHLFEDLSLKALSEHFFLSVSQCSRLFRQATGTTVWDYILTKRLLAAKSSIKKGDSITAAAQTCGFRDYSAFYRAYKKQFGHAPKADAV